MIPLAVRSFAYSDQHTVTVVAAGGHTPALSESLTVGGDDSHLLTPNDRPAKFCHDVLVRDQHRCIMTGTLNRYEWRRRYREQPHLAIGIEREPERLDAAHIIAHALGTRTSDENVSYTYSG